MKRLFSLVAALLVCMFPVNLSAVTESVFDRIDKAFRARDYKTAIELMRPLTEKGDAKAQHFLGMMYYLGRGVPQDYVKAYKWLSLAGSKGYKMAQQTQTKLDGIMTPEQITEAKALAKKWSEKN